MDPVYQNKFSAFVDQSESYTPSSLLTGSVDTPDFLDLSELNGGKKGNHGGNSGGFNSSQVPVYPLSIQSDSGDLFCLPCGGSIDPLFGHGGSTDEPSLTCDLQTAAGMSHGSSNGLPAESRSGSIQGIDRTSKSTKSVKNQSKSVQN